jgi:hypothetical protein
MEAWALEQLAMGGGDAADLLAILQGDSMADCLRFWDIGDNG